MPEAWRLVPLGDATISDDSKRRPVKSADRVAGPYPYWGASGVVDHVDAYLFDYTTLLVSEDGENLRTRKTPIAFLVSGKYWVNNHAHVLRARPDFDLRFLAYAVEHTDISGYITGSTQPKLTAGNLARLKIWCPPLPDQVRIAGVLGTLDGLVEANRKLMTDLEDLAAAEFARAGFDSPGARQLDEYVAVNPFYAKPKGVAPYVDMAALSEVSSSIDRVQEREASGGARFANFDTLLARITPCLENGKTAFVDCLEAGAIGVGSTEFIVLRAGVEIPAAWPYFLARSPRFRDHVVRHMTGTSGRQRCPAEAVSGYRLNDLDATALKEFASLVEPIMEAIRQLAIEVRELSRVRDELLPQLMSGNVLVGDAAS